MPDKFIIHGAAFNGDGTSSAEATSNGGVGAWNTITYFEGTAPAFGSIGAGDVIYIRSKDASGNDIVRSTASTFTLGSTAALSTNPVHWVIDGGNKWPGVNGSVLYTSSSATGGLITLRTANTFTSQTKSALVLQGTNASINQANVVVFQTDAVLRRSRIEWFAENGGANGANISFGAMGRMESCHIRAGKIRLGLFSPSGTGNSFEAVDCDFELLNTINGLGAFINSSSVHVVVRIIGGRLYGPGAIPSQFYLGSTNTTFHLDLIGFQYPNTITATNSAYITPNQGGRILSYGTDGSATAASAYSNGFLESRVDDNYPVLNATLPFSNGQGWSWKVTPRATESSPMAVHIGKVYQEADAAKTITCEILLSTAISAGVNAGNTWLEVSYIGTDGVPVALSSRVLFSTTALDSSSADWQPNVGGDVSYGAVSLVKRKITITTPTAIKQNSLVRASLCTTFYGSTIASDIMFVCPDVQLT